MPDAALIRNISTSLNACNTLTPTVPSTGCIMKSYGAPSAYCRANYRDDQCHSSDLPLTPVQISFSLKSAFGIVTNFRVRPSVVQLSHIADSPAIRYMLCSSSDSVFTGTQTQLDTGSNDSVRRWCIPFRGDSSVRCRSCNKPNTRRQRCWW